MSAIAHKREILPESKPGLLFRAILDPGTWKLFLRQFAFLHWAHAAQIRRMAVGPGARISPFASFSNGERIRIGARVRIGDRCCFWAGHGEATITIGDDAMFGPDVMIQTSRYRYEDGAPIARQLMEEEEVRIGNDVWLGARVVVMPGAVIGDGAVIGAGSVVRGTIPPMSVALGSPARVVGRRHLETPPAELVALAQCAQ